MPISYVVNRFGLLPLIVWFAISINFIIPRLIPGEPVEASRVRSELDRPQWKQYLTYWQDILKGDLGVSLVSFQTA